MSQKAITFIHRGGPMMASFRYRAAIPAQTLGTMNGFRSFVNEGESEVYVFSKPVADDVEIAKRAKAHGAKVIADIGDAHFEHPSFGPIYHEMVKLADAVVAPTETGADLINAHTGRVVMAVIPDPYEEALHEPHANDDKYLWFGHASNLSDLLQWMPHLKGIDLKIVTGPNQALKIWTQWTPDVQTRSLAEANVVLLPTRKGAEYKSPNRLVNALRAGCFPVCQTHPAYAEFRKFVWVGNFVTGVRWSQHFKDDMNGLVAEGQKYVEKYSPANVSQQWAQLLEAL